MTNSSLQRSVVKILHTFFLVVGLCLIAFLFRAESAYAAPVGGYAWSDNIGWICFDCGTANVAIDVAGNFSGYAWSDNIGWIDFNPSSGFPGTPNNGVRLSGSSVTGWARALSYGGGWDGWIKMSGGAWSNGVTYSNPNFSGYAWGSDVVGWVDFSRVTYSSGLPLPVVNGSCGATNNACTSGSLNNIPDTATDYLWNCNGSGGGSNASCSLPIPAGPATADVVVHSILCDSVTDIPDWSDGPTNITSATALNFVSGNPNCSLDSNWSYQWRLNSPIPYGFSQNAGAQGSPWNTFGPTNGSTGARASLTSAQLSGNPIVNIRQVGRGAGYVQFSENQPDWATAGTYPAFWCHTDVEKYNNQEQLLSGQAVVGNTYYCVAFNVRSVVPQPDLISKNITLSAGPYTSGTAISLSAGVENDSTVAVSDGFSDNFSYSWTSATGPWTDIVPFVSHGTGISAGATLPDSGSFTPNQSGTLYIQHCVDSNREIDEGPNENPNCSVHSGVAVGSAPLDLEPVNPSIQSQTDNGDGTYDLSIRVGIRNLGPGTLPALSNIPYRTNILLGGGGTIVGPTDNFNGSISPVSSAGPFFHTLNNIPFGSHQVCSRVNLDPVRFTETPPANNASNQNCQPLTLDVPPPNVLEITSDKEFIRAGETATIIWDILAPYAMTCTVKGPGGVNEGPFNVSANVLTHSDTPTTALNSTGEYKLNCAETTTGTVFTDVTVVEIIPDYEER
ncbi:hypothetical protein H6781_02475 [Candidatus Nomurabacteria bacterium]|nr:hypothetical protein [Candidatus Nomurabacteria bacterium]